MLGGSIGGELHRYGSPCPTASFSRREEWLSPIAANLRDDLRYTNHQGSLLDIGHPLKSPNGGSAGTTSKGTWQAKSALILSLLPLVDSSQREHPSCTNFLEMLSA